MITQWLMQLVAWLWEHVLVAMPSLPVPSWFATAHDSVAGITDHIAGLGAWFPFGVLGTVLGTVLFVAAASLTIKVVRIVASFLTAGGGSAG